MSLRLRPPKTAEPRTSSATGGYLFLDHLVAGLDAELRGGEVSNGKPVGQRGRRRALDGDVPLELLGVLGSLCRWHDRPDDMPGGRPRMREPGLASGSRDRS